MFLYIHAIEKVKQNFETKKQEVSNFWWILKNIWHVKLLPLNQIFALE